MHPPFNLLIFLGLVLSSFAVSAAADGNNTNDTTEQCGFYGESDTYGLGIRLGVYFQWIATALSYNFAPDKTVRGVNNCFQLSIFVGLLYITRTGGRYAVEVFIVLMLCIGGACSNRGFGNCLEGDPSDGDSSDGGEHTMSARFLASKVGGIIQLMLWVALIIYAVWFVFLGMDGMVHSPCSHSAFFFINVDLYGWYRTLLKVVFTISAMLVGICTLFSIRGIADMFRNNDAVSALSAIFRFREETSRIEGYNGDDHETTLESTDFPLDLVFFILSIELAIKWNNIQSVNELGRTGQLLPLIVGGMGLISVLYECIVKVIQGKYRISKSYNFGFVLPFPSMKQARSIVYRPKGIFNNDMESLLGGFPLKKVNRNTKDDVI